MSKKRECYECKHCSVEDLWNEFICLKRNKQLCPTIITEENDIIYPACEDFEEEDYE